MHILRTVNERMTCMNAAKLLPCFLVFFTGPIHFRSVRHVLPLALQPRNYKSSQSWRDIAGAVICKTNLIAFEGLGESNIAVFKRAQGNYRRAGLHQQAFSKRIYSTGPAKTTSTALHRLSRFVLYTRRTVASVFAISLITFVLYYLTDTRAAFHRNIAAPVLRLLHQDAEEAHEAGVEALKYLYRFRLHPRDRSGEDDSEILKVKVFGHVLRNPVAISAGLDKHADIVSPLFTLGPAIVEIGGVTPLLQDGNEKPRMWRVPSQRALINRYGLNSKGAAHVARQLRRRVKEFAAAQGLGIGLEAERLVLDGDAGVPPGSLSPGKLLAIQIAKNKATPERDFEAVTRDYVQCCAQLAEYADIIVVNVSSPNTPGLRSLQEMEPLREILTGVVDATKAVRRRTRPAVMVKVSPDENSDVQITDICRVIWQSGVDGVIVANTTRQRPQVKASAQSLSEQESICLQEPGGYSGPALFPRTLELVGRYRRALDISLSGSQNDGKVRKTIFASGGICSGNDVSQALLAGADVAMVYTAMVYEGSGFITSLKRQTREAIQRSASG